MWLVVWAMQWSWTGKRGPGSSTLFVTLLHMANGSRIQMQHWSDSHIRMTITQMMQTSGKQQIGSWQNLWSWTSTLCCWNIMRSTSMIGCCLGKCSKSSQTCATPLPQELFRHCTFDRRILQMTLCSAFFQAPRRPFRRHWHDICPTSQEHEADLQDLRYPLKWRQMFVGRIARIGPFTKCWWQLSMSLQWPQTQTPAARSTGSIFERNPSQAGAWGWGVASALFCLPNPHLQIVGKVTPVLDDPSNLPWGIFTTLGGMPFPPPALTESRASSWRRGNEGIQIIGTWTHIAWLWPSYLRIVECFISDLWSSLFL